MIRVLIAWLVCAGVAIGVTELWSWPASTFSQIVWGGTAGVLGVLIGTAWKAGAQ